MKITQSSGKVFADIGFPPDEAVNPLARAMLMARLVKIAEARELTQQKVA